MFLTLFSITYIKTDKIELIKKKPARENISSFCEFHLVGILQRLVLMFSTYAYLRYSNI